MSTMTTTSLPLSKASNEKHNVTHIDVVEVDSDTASDSSSLSSRSDNNTPSDSSFLSSKPETFIDGTQNSTPVQRDLNATHLISSPYSDLENQLRLEDLETPYKLFAFALTALKPIRADYATAPYLESFNWEEVFALLRELCEEIGHEWRETSFYTVMFRSVLLEETDRERLGFLDRMSHQEACASGGLLKYWYGCCDSEMRNLATCLWRSSNDAHKGGGGPWHAQARLAARTMYKQIVFPTHQLFVEDGARAWRLG